MLHSTKLQIKCLHMFSCLSDNCMTICYPEGLCIFVHSMLIVVISLYHRGLSPAECDRKILDLSSRFTLYGLDFHDALVSNCIMTGATSIVSIYGLYVSNLLPRTPNKAYIDVFAC